MMVFPLTPLECFVAKRYDMRRTSEAKDKTISSSICASYYARNRKKLSYN